MPGRSWPPVEESALKPIEQRVDQGAAAARVFVLAGAGVHHHACGLVDHGERGIFKDHVQRNVFSRGFERSGVRLAGDDDLLAAAQFERRLDARAIDQHVALIEQQLHARAAYAVELRGEEMIETLTGGLERHRDGACVTHDVPR